MITLPEVVIRTRPNEVLTVFLEILYDSSAPEDGTAKQDSKEGFNLLGRLQEMASAWRVASFFAVVFILPTLLICVPLYARYNLFQSRSLMTLETDMIALDRWASSFWCQGQIAKTNGTLDGYLLASSPRIKKERRPTVTFEENVRFEEDDAVYWGFHLLEGSKISVSACAKLPGAAILLVRGEKSLKRCFYEERRPLQGHAAQAGNPAREDETQEDLGAGGGDLDLRLLRKVQDGFQESSAPTEDAKNGKRSHLKDAGRGPNRTRRAVKKAKSYSAPLQELRIDNDTVTAGNSSASSSEEFLERCDSLIPAVGVPFFNCSSDGRLEVDAVVVDASDHYYIILTSDNSKEYNLVTLRMYLKRKVYALEDHIDMCTKSSKCAFPLSFLRSRSVVVEMNSSGNKTKVLKNYELSVTCEPRIAVYMVFILLVPFTIMLFAFK